MTRLSRLTLACAACVLSLNTALAQTPSAAPATPPEAAAPEYVPKQGQQGKDVIWVPTQQALIDRMLEMAGLTEQDYLVDLGSGDGRTVITAAKRGARAHGIEYNADLVALSQRTARAEGVSDKATFEKADIFASDFSKATVVTLFLLPELNIKLRPILLDMAPGTRVVSNSFTMDEWEPDQSAGGGPECSSYYCQAHAWVVPAKLHGNWRLANGELRLEQTYQKLEGTLLRDGQQHALSEARIDGRKVAFTAGGQRYEGELRDGRLVGRVDLSLIHI